MAKVTLEAIDETGRSVFKKLPRINSGGCCVYAAHMAQALQSVGLGSKCRVSSLFSDPRDLNKIRRFANPLGNWKEWRKQGVNFDHVLVEFELAGVRYYHDAENTTAENDMDTDDGYLVEPTVGGKLCDGWLEIDEALALSEIPYAWNSMFDRERGIPIINRAISDFLERVSNNA